MKTIKLTRTERLLLSNQYTILKKLEPDSAKHFDRLCEILEHGYEGEYDHAFVGIYEHGLSDDECTEVIYILDMHFAMMRSYDSLADKTGFTASEIEFSGFDGNNETSQMAYALFLRRDGRFVELQLGDGYNSHFPSLDRYRRMLAAWKAIPSDGQYSMTATQLRALLDAK